MKQGLIGVACAVIVVAIIVGGYLGGWWLNTDINNRNAHLRRTTFEQQATFRDEITRKIADVRTIDTEDQTPEVIAQRQAIVDIICRDNTHINGGLDSASAAFVQENC